MGEVASDTFDAVQFLNDAAKNAADLLGDAALAGGTAGKIVSVTLVGKVLVFSVIADITLNGEEPTQAAISQVGAAAIGSLGLIVLTAAGAPVIAAAAGGAAAAYFGDKLLDMIYEWSSNNDILELITDDPISISTVPGAVSCLAISSSATIGSENATLAPPPPYYDPLVLDLDGDGLEFISLTDSQAKFDLTGDNFATQTAWLSGDDGFLALDRNGDGVINNIDELFGNDSQDGFEELAALMSMQMGK